jgi:nucleoid DNA-binding protein
MQNRDKIIREVAKDLGIPQTKVREAVSSQTGLVRKAMQKKEAVSVYLRQVGTFISPGVKKSLSEQKKFNRENRQKEENIEYPTHF